MSLSINTNNSAMAALQSLDQTTDALNKTENEVSTGYAVGSASDNPAIYSIAQTMNSQISALSGVSTGLQYTAQVLNTASGNASSISSLLTSLTSAISTGVTNGVNADTMNSQISSFLSQIDSDANTATFQGVNLLSGATGNGVQYTSVSTAQDINGNLYTQSGFNATAAGLGLAGLNINQSGSKLALGANQFVTSDGATGGGSTTASTLSISNSVASGTGTAQNPSMTYDFVMDSNSAGMQSTTSLATALNTALTGSTTAPKTTDPIDLSVGADGKITNGGTSKMTTSTANGVTTYSFDNGESLSASKDASGNIVYTASTAFDANGNATAKTMVVDVNTSADASASSSVTSGSSVSAQTVAQTSTLMQAMSNAGFGVSTDASNTLTIAGNNISSTSPSMTGMNANSTTAATTITATTTSGYEVALSAVQAAVTKMNSISSAFGSATNQVSQLESSTSSLSSALTSGVGALTDADLASESAKLTSLQTKQQLAIQSLSIANSQSSTLLSLFRG